MEFMSAWQFERLGVLDFQNGAVRNEIHNSLVNREQLQAEKEVLETNKVVSAQEYKQLKAENKGLKERIFFALEDLPECPDEAMKYLKPVIKEK